MPRYSAAAVLLRVAGLTVLAGCMTCATGPTGRIRVLEFSATLSAVAPGMSAASGSAQVGLDEWTGSCTAAQTIGFVVLGTGLSGAPTAVHIHEGSPAAPGRLIYTLPLFGSQFAPEVITTSGASRVMYQGPFAGELAYTELWEALSNRTAYIDVHAGNATAPELAGQLTVLQSADWHSVRCGST